MLQHSGQSHQHNVIHSFGFSLNDEGKQKINEDGVLEQYDVPIARDGSFDYRAGEIGFLTADQIDPMQLLSLYRSKNSFTKEILDKNKDIPFTNDHPEQGVNIENARQVRVGSVQNLYFKDGTLYAGLITIYDQDTIGQVQNGKKEVSIGFEAYYKITPTRINGQQYDGTEDIIRINHLSLVDKGKAGQDFKLHKHEELPVEKVNMNIGGEDLKVDANLAFALNREQTETKFQTINSQLEALTQSVNALVAQINADDEKEEDKKEDKEDTADSKNRVGCDEPIKEDKLSTGKNADEDEKEEDSKESDTDNASCEDLQKSSAKNSEEVLVKEMTKAFTANSDEVIEKSQGNAHTGAFAEYVRELRSL